MKTPKLQTLLILFIIPSALLGQQERKLMREGNELYKDGKFNESEIKFRKSLQKDPKNFVGNFNLGDALYKQGKYSEALEQFKKISDKATDKNTLSKTYHNLGNALLQEKKYEESIDAYKKALKAVPSDADTKYNLAYAKTMLKQQQQQQQQQQNKNNKDNKDQDKNKQDQQNKDNKDQDKKDDKGEQNKDKNDQNKDQQQAKQQPKISKEDAQRMLEALNNKERDLQKKLGKKDAVRIQVEKDW